MTFWYSPSAYAPTAPSYVIWVVKYTAGSLVNDRMETSIPGVYAAGDCTECDDISCGRKRVLALFPNAYMQGYAAGVNMAGGDQVFDNAIPMNSIGFFGLHAMTAGSCFGEDQGGECYEEKADGKIKRLFTRNGYLTGFTLIGETDRAGIYTSLIRERIPLGVDSIRRFAKKGDLCGVSAGYP